jgi:hypothetical protein
VSANNSIHEHSLQNMSIEYHINTIIFNHGSILKSIKKEDLFLITNNLIKQNDLLIFFNNNNISISNINSMTTSTDSSEEVIFAPGKLRFILSPFDNVLKLKVFTEATLANAENPLVSLDLNVNSAKYRLVFETTTGKIAIDNVNDSNQENLSTGQVTFNIAKKDSEAVLNSSNRTLYLISVSQDGRETLMYTGEWRKPSEQADVDAAIAQAKADAASKKDTSSILNGIRDRISLITKLDLANKVDLRSNVKNKGEAPVVNRFGVAGSKSIRTSGSNSKNK